MHLTQLPHLETFAKAAELSSFTATARAMGLTQAAISQRVQALEQALKCPLFQRQGGHVLLTDAGHRLYGYAQRILALHRDAIADITGHVSPLTGELALAASSVPGEHLLPDLLARFQETQPHVQVKATVTDSQQVLQQVEQGHVHLGLVGGRREHPHLEFRPFAKDRLLLIVAPTHPWASRKRITANQLSEQPLILREAGSGSRWCLEQALTQEQMSLTDLNVGMQLGSNEAIKEAVSRGLGAAFLSNRSVQREIDTGRFRAVTVSGLTLERDIYVIWDRRRVLPIPAQLFLDLIGAGRSPV